MLLLAAGSGTKARVQQLTTNRVVVVVVVVKMIFFVATKASAGQLSLERYEDSVYDEIPMACSKTL